jgi:coenzyme PQQ synthesis protein D (PqqD)
MAERAATDGARLTLRAPHVIHEAIDGEVIVINLSTGAYYSLRGSAAEAWELIQRPDGIDTSQLIAVLATRYEASPEELSAAFDPFVAELGREGLVERSEGAGESVAPDPAAARGNGHQDSLAFEAPKLEKFTDMQDLVLLDPVHEVDDVGWPAARPDAAKGD